MKLPKELVLNYRTWICGQPDINENKKNCHGKGFTSLLNKEGFMCCLGQFSKQAKCKKEDLLYVSMPEELDKLIVGLTKKKKNMFGDLDIIDTKMSERAININDDEDTTIIEKVRGLRKTFGRNGYTIKLKNFPKTYLAELEDK